MPIFRSILSWLIFKRRSQIELFKKYPIDVQNETFFKLINAAKDTVWGKYYDFKSFESIKAFQERIPIQSYESMKPWIERARQGERNVLWHSEIKWFAKSSGTTGDKSKFIPVSKEALEDCHFKGGKDAIVIYSMNFPESKLLSGKGLVIGGSQQINNYNNDLYYGDLSAVLIQNLPFWVQFLRTPDMSITLMDDWEEKIRLMAEATIKENVTNISGVPSWTLVLLKKIFEITGKTNLLDVWPDLELFIHGGVSFTLYREQYDRLFAPRKIQYLETYNASEGFFSIQDDPTSDDMLLMLDYGIFYEFVPIDELENEFPKAVLLEEVELGKNYAIVISTNGGLWRYMIGDTVRFTNLNPFKIKITGRTKHFINAFGEEIIIDNAEKALQKASNICGALIREYSAAPIFLESDKKGGHEWLIEFEIPPQNIEQFSTELDNALKEQNSDYEAKRVKNIFLNPPKIVIARNNLFYQWLKEKGKLGGQHKIPRLANHRTYIEELLKMNQEIE